MSTRYGFTTSVAGGFEQVVERVTQALKAEGFGVLTTIDAAATLKNKLGVDMPRYLILGACNPGFAHRALQADPDIGLLLPCNVVVREQPDKKINVGFMDPIAVLKLTDNPAITALAGEVRDKLERVRDKLVAN
ncbi:MAG: DUF302 domain-containing protein [Betaproteobacteria bacterium]|nr:DUF302 domain-containing protein [Betaproteobacteria bacterium]